MAGKLATAYIDIVGRITKFRDSLRQSQAELKGFAAKAKAKFAGLRRYMQRHAKYIALAVGAAALAVMRSAVRSSSWAEEQAAKFRAVFKGQAESTLKWAQAYSRSVKRSKHDLVEWLAAVQDIFVPMGFARDEAADFSKKLVKLAIDLASFQDKAEPDVLRDLTSGLMGMSRAMFKYGVNIRDGRVQQKAFQMGLARAGEAVSETAKLQARYQLIVEDTKDAQDDAIRTADSFANTMRALKAAIHDAAVEHGNWIKKAIKPGVKWLTTLIEKHNEHIEIIKNSRKEIKKAQAEGGYNRVFDFRTGITYWAKDVEKAKKLIEEQRKVQRKQLDLRSAKGMMRDQARRLTPEDERKRADYLQEQMRARQKLFDQMAKWGATEEDLSKHKEEIKKRLLALYDKELEAVEKLREQQQDTADTLREMSKSYMSPIQKEVAALYDRAAKFRKVMGNDIRIKNWVENEKLKIAKRHIETEMGMVSDLSDAVRQVWEPQWMASEDKWKRGMVAGRSVTTTTTPAQAQAATGARANTILAGILTAVNATAKAEEQRLRLERDAATESLG